MGEIGTSALMTDYDVIVIGSGMGGLTSAALLAKAGKSVLILEAHDRPGGYAHGFKRKKYHFDSGVHLISGCDKQGYCGGQVIYKTLKALALLDDIEFININPFSHAFYPELSIALPQEISAFVSQLSQQFPTEKQGLQALLKLCLQLAEEITIADEMMAKIDHQQAIKLMPGLFKYRKSTLGDVAKLFINDPKLLAVFASNWPYLGLPPSQVSFVYWSTMLMGYMVDGAYYCKGGFQQLANTLVKGLQGNGGEICYKSSVEKIMIAQGQVLGVELKGQQLSAPIVISNADIRNTVCNMAGEQYFPPRFVQKIKTMQQSLSIFVVYLATNLDLKALNIHHESFCYSDFNHDKNFAKTQQGIISWLSITAPTLVDSSLAPEGEHLLMLTTLLPFQSAEYCKQSKTRYIQTMLTLAEQTIPNLQQHLLFVEGGSPATMQRYTQNYKGAAYGWDVTPSQVGPARIQNQSPIKGLFFSGHWTAPGGGVYGVSVSGVQTAQKVLGIAKQSDFFKKISQGT